MLWTAEAVEDLKKLALEGKSAAGIAAALGVGSRNAVIGKASRIGIKLNGGGRAAASSKTGARRAQWATIANHPPGAAKPGSAVALARDPRAEPGQGREARTFGEAEVGEMRRLRFEEIAQIRLPVAARRSEKRGLRLLRAHAGGRPVLLRRPLPDGLPVPTGEAERERPAGISRHREFVAGGLRAGARSAGRRRSGRARPRPLRAAPTPTG